MTKHYDVAEGEVINKVLTLPNIISFLRLCLVPLFLALLFLGHDIAAAIVFGIAAGTDFVDGQVARRTHTVSKLGQLLDPVVDRVLMISCVCGLLILGRLPLWIVVLVLVRDIAFLIGGAYLLRHYNVRVAVVYPGKVATTLLFIGLAGLVINMPLINGLGWTSVSWLPGFNALPCSWGIGAIYFGLIIGFFTSIYYIIAGIKGLRQSKQHARSSNGNGNV